MSTPDVVRLKQFYAGALGQCAASLLWRRLRDIWPEAAGEHILGLGFATPYCSPLSENKTIIIAAMPAEQGALYWPSGHPNRALLVHDGQLPFADNTFNRVLLIHALEHSAHPQQLLKDIWRVLTPGGRLLIVVPSRMGLWARAHNNPFGFGRPYSLGQVKDIVAESGLTFLRSQTALFMPPSERSTLIKLARYAELFGLIACPGMGGVLLVEAEKQIYAAVRETARERIVRSASNAAPQPAFSSFTVRKPR